MLHFHKSVSNIQKKIIMLKDSDKLYDKLIPPGDLNKIIHEVIQTPAFQRLYGITHGGFKSDPIQNYQFSNIRAAHNRGDHCTSAALLAHHLYHPSLELDKVHFVLAALLHDVGHSAYSHLGELALGICHKDLTTQIILNNPDLVKIWNTHRIDPKEIVKAALEKTPRNPITVPRESGKMSIDHLNNTFFDVYARLGDEVAKRTAQALLAHTKIQDGVIVLSKKPDLQSAFTKTSIEQNTSIVFNPKDLLLDQLAAEYIRSAVNAGVIQATDLQGNQEDVNTVLSSRDAISQAPHIWDLFTRLVPNIRREYSKDFVKLETGTQAKPPTSQQRKIDSTYLMTIPLEKDIHRIIRLPIFAEYDKQLVGTYTFTDYQEIRDQLAFRDNSR